jgi:hypothetical protein
MVLQILLGRKLPITDIALESAHAEVMTIYVPFKCVFAAEMFSTSVYCTLVCHFLFIVSRGKTLKVVK